MKNRHKILLILLLTCSVFADEVTDKEEFIWQYSEIVTLIEGESWVALEKFELSNIRCGFGPGEEGVGCIKKLMHSEPECKARILNVLYQGCILIDKNPESWRCIAPPQSQNPQVIMPLSARVSLRYNPVESQASIASFICGGD